MILKWNEQLLSAIRAYPGPTGPTITSRALGVLHTATYDAWAAYDPTAKVHPPGTVRSSRPASLNTPANKNKAISYAAYRVLNDLFPSRFLPCPAQSPSPFCPIAPSHQPPFAWLRAPGVLLTSSATTPPTPRRPVLRRRGHSRRVGNLGRQGRADYRHTDGSNQLGRPHGHARRYSDTTGYVPKNTWDNVTHPWRWQPLCVPLPDPGAAAPAPSRSRPRPQWGNVKMFWPLAASSFRVNGPPKNPDGSYSTVDLPIAIEDAANLTDVEKATAEYWADGPKSEFPPGHTAIFAQAISRKHGHSLDTDVKLFFTARERDDGRRHRRLVPEVQVRLRTAVTAIREHYKDQMVNSWLGPNQGFGDVPADQWKPYQAPTWSPRRSPSTSRGHSHLHLAPGRDPGNSFNGERLRRHRPHPGGLVEVRVRQTPRPRT